MNKKDRREETNNKHIRKQQRHSTEVSGLKLENQIVARVDKKN